MAFGIVLALAVSSLANSVVIAATSSFTSQTDAVALTTLYTPTAAGDYRVWLYMETSGFVNNATQVACGYLVWVGDFATYTPGGTGTFAPNGYNSPCLYPDAFTTYSWNIHAAANQPIKFRTTIGFEGTAGSPPVASYNVYVVVEKL